MLWKDINNITFYKLYTLSFFYVDLHNYLVFFGFYFKMQKDKNLYLQLWGSIMQVGIIALADVCASEHSLSIFQTSVYEHKCLHWLACLSDFYLFVFKFEKSQITVILWILRPKVIEYLMEPGPLPFICFDIYFYYFEFWYCFEL